MSGKHGRRSCDGWSNKHARTPRGAGQCFMHDHITLTPCVTVLVCEECPAPCPRSTQEQRTNAHATQHGPPCLNKWFHILPSFYSLPAPRLSTNLIHSIMLILRWYVCCYFEMRLCTHGVISLALCGRCENDHAKLGIQTNEYPDNVNMSIVIICYKCIVC